MKTHHLFEYHHQIAAELWNSPYRIIVFYNNKRMCARHDWLWPKSTIDSSWPHATKLPFLENFLLHHLTRRHKDRFYVSQGIITPSVGIIARGIVSLGFFPSSIDKLENKVNEALLVWLQGLPKQKRKLLNIIMIDWCTRDMTQKFLKFIETELGCSPADRH